MWKTIIFSKMQKKVWVSLSVSEKLVTLHLQNNWDMV